MSEVSVGPYMNDDGDWWVPVAAGSFRDARAAVVSCLNYSIPDEGTLVYAGRQVAYLDSKHEAGCPETCPSMRPQVAFHFKENPR